MRLAVITDIHGNFRALQAVLADITSQSIARIVSLGDNVGYGPEPDEVVRTLVHHRITSIRGNHELALVNAAYYQQLNPPTRLSLDLTRGLLTQTSLDWLADLEPTLQLANGTDDETGHRCRFVHGCPPDSTTTYLLNPTDARLQHIFAGYPEAICFAGHTHTLDMYVYHPDAAVEHLSLAIGRRILARNSRYLIIPGSVGQPRDTVSNRAKYAIWDQDQNSLEIRAVPYDVSTTIRLINERGFPASNGLRLQW